MSSVNTNVGAMIALQNLNATSSDLQATQNRISTGLKVSSAKDDGAAYAIAQSQRATVSSLDAVKDSLSRGSSVVRRWWTFPCRLVNRSPTCCRS